MQTSLAGNIIEVSCPAGYYFSAFAYYSPLYLYQLEYSIEYARDVTETKIYTMAQSETNVALESLLGARCSSLADANVWNISNATVCYN